jgi:hypothetical protein
VTSFAIRIVNGDAVQRDVSFDRIVPI